jgi:type 1 fimbria pilin
MRTYAARCALVLSLAAAGPLHAGCFAHPSQGAPQTVSFGTVEVPVDAPAGTVLAERSSSGWGSPKFKCFYPQRTASLGLFTRPSPLGEHIYETNVPGIGMRVYFYNSNYGELPVPDDTKIPFVFDAQLTNAHFRVQLIKTADVIQGGALSHGTLARGGFDGQAQAWVDLVDARVEPQRPTCAFASRRLVFALDKVDGGTLAVAGSSHWATQQLVSTGCTNATQILMTFTGTADEADPSLFKLNGSGAATGVAIELRSDEPDAQAVPNSASPLILRAVREGQSYGFRARYRTTGKPLAPGAANASITVNVAYR